MNNKKMTTLELDVMIVLLRLWNFIFIRELT